MMITGLLLAGYAVILGTAGAWLLRRADWTERAPRLGVFTWQILCASILGAVWLAGLVMLSPGGRPDLAAVLHSAEAIKGGDLGHGVLALICLLFISFAVLTFATSLVAGARSLFCSHRERSRLLAELASVGRHDESIGATVIDHDMSAAYCLPGKHGAVVLTTAAIDALDNEELTAVLAHERAHLRGRHDLILSVASALRSAFRFVPAFRWAHEEQSRLLEMIADDAGARAAGRFTVASAMVRMAEAAAPAPAMGAGGSHAVQRVHRMLRPERPIGRMQAFVFATFLLAVAAAPIAIAAGPTAAEVGMQACGLGGPSGT